MFDPRDLGSKNQQGSIPTRYGPKDTLTRFVAVAHGCGLDVYLDLVMHQRIGENGGPGIFWYLGSDGVSLNGRGQTWPGWFRGVPPDNLPDDDVPSPYFDFPFGRELSYQHCRPPRVTIEDALDFGEWVFRTTGADGARFDDVKGTWAPFVREFMTHGTMASKFFYAEYFDGNPAALNRWATGAPMSGRSLVEDFTMHWALQSACDAVFPNRETFRAHSDDGDQPFQRIPISHSDASDRTRRRRTAAATLRAPRRAWIGRSQSR